MKQATFFLILVSGFLFSCSNDDSQDSDNPNNPPDSNYHLQGVGDSAEDLLRQDNFNTLTIEVLYVSGFQPTDGTISNLSAFLGNRLNKSSVNVTLNEISSPGLAPYSVNEIIDVEEEYRTAFNDNSELTVFAFFADGSFSDNNNVLGVAYRNTSVALFEQRIQELSGGVGQPSQTLLESTVLQHEFGHIMGLVNVGTPLQSNHQDEAHGKHCDVQDCLMYYTAETGDVVSNLIGLGSVPDLDSQCIADLQANGGR